MHCPYCNHGESKVTDSRNSTDMNAVRRRRECLACGKRFTTFETVDSTIQVKKRNGYYEDYQQEKLIRGIAAACRHTRTSVADVNALASKISADLMEKQKREITTTELGQIVMDHLRKLDPIAYIRFACVYRRFKNVDELVEALKDVTPKDEENLEAETVV